MTKEEALEICRRIVVEGVTVAQACRDMGVPKSTFFTKVVDDADVDVQYARARQVQCHQWIDEIISLADDKSGDQKISGDRPYFDHDHISRMKLQIDTRKWAASKALPKLYGDKVEIDGKLNHKVEPFKLKDIINFE